MDDILDGGPDADYLEGELGHDTLIGGAGDDTLDGGGGMDTIYLGTGNDTYINLQEDGLYRIALALATPDNFQITLQDPGGLDRLTFENVSGGDDLLIGGDGTDTILDVDHQGQIQYDGIVLNSVKLTETGVDLPHAA